MKWEDISKRLPGRSAISCRLHYQNFLERKAEWDDEKDNKLSRLYDRFKREMWEKIANDLQMPWRAVEARHWELGAEGLALRAGVPLFSSNSSSTVADNVNMHSANMGLSSRQPSGVLGPPLYGYVQPPQGDLRQPSGYVRRRERSPQAHSAPQHPPSFAYHNYAPYSSRGDPYQLPQPASNAQHRPTGMMPSSTPQYIPSRPRSDSPTLGSYGSTGPDIQRAPSSSSTSASASPYESPHFTQGERLPPMRLLTEPSGTSQGPGPGQGHGVPPEMYPYSAPYRGR